MRTVCKEVLQFQNVVDAVAVAVLDSPREHLVKRFRHQVVGEGVDVWRVQRQPLASPRAIGTLADCARYGCAEWAAPSAPRATQGCGRLIHGSPRKVEFVQY